MPTKNSATIVYELPSRSLLKSITFRIFVLLSDTLIVSAITGRATETFAIVFFTNLASTVLYYIHERVWSEWKLLQISFNRHELTSAQLTKSFIKALTFRVVVICSDLLVTTSITRSAIFAVDIIALTNLGSTVVYYLHEVIWNLITWGKKLRKI